MCRFSQCCCCKLVVGVYVIAGWTIGICGLGVGLMIYEMRMADIMCEIYRDKYKYNVGYSIYRYVALVGIVHYCYKLYIGLCFKLAVLSLWILSAGGLIAGALKKKRHAYIPWIVMTSIVLGLNALAACYVFYKVSINHDLVQLYLSSGYTYLYMSLYAINIGIEIYSLAVICNHFRQLKQEQLQCNLFKLSYQNSELVSIC